MGGSGLTGAVSIYVQDVHQLAIIVCILVRGAMEALFFVYWKHYSFFD